MAALKDNLAIATKQNKIGRTRLSTELDRINREHYMAMRMHRNARQIFRNKYEKNQPSQLAEDIVSEASETASAATESLRPASRCDRRPGLYRLHPSCITNSSLNMQDLRNLLFSRGEIDIDKVLCLYLLAAHRTDTLRIPAKNKQMVNFPMHYQSPLERLIDRSRRSIDHKLNKVLPIYILDLPPGPTPPKETAKDPRLNGKVIINTKITQIVESVLSALEVCNPDLMHTLVHTAQDKDELQLIMGKPNMVSFIKGLYGQNIISNCESFHMVSHHKDRMVSFALNAGPLETFVRIIRQHVLLKPNSNTWKVYNPPREKKEKAPHERTLNEEELKERIDISSTDVTLTMSTSIGDTSTAATLAVTEPNAVRPNDPKEQPNSEDKDESQLEETIADESLASGSCTNLDDFSLHIDSDDGDVSLRQTIAQLQPKIRKNLQLGFSAIKLENTAAFGGYTETLPLDTLASLLSKQVRKESKMEYRNMNLGESPSVTKVLASSEPAPVDEIPPIQGLPASMAKMRPQHHIKQTTCYACLARWQTPLPTPKISKIKKIALPQLKETSYYSSKSAQRISVLINNEVKKFEQSQEQERGLPEKETLAERIYKRIREGSPNGEMSIEIIDLDKLELAKIRQEIKETETLKKLRKFMDTPV